MASTTQLDIRGNDDSELAVEAVYSSVTKVRSSSRSSRISMSGVHGALQLVAEGTVPRAQRCAFCSMCSTGCL